MALDGIQTVPSTNCLCLVVIWLRFPPQKKEVGCVSDEVSLSVAFQTAIYFKFNHVMYINVHQNL